MARNNGETKPERIARAVAEAVRAGKDDWKLETVDFSDIDRPKTCLEVDFPILPINNIAEIEGKGSGALKPIYQTMKWWARRRSTVFRQLLMAAVTKSPLDATESARMVWDAYYGNHQKNEGFRKLKVADIFMGGGTTIVEGARLGMQMYGSDLNPVAWFVVKNELSKLAPVELQRFFDQIEAEVKPQIMPFYACECPRGHKGQWTHKPTSKPMPASFDPLTLTPQQRPEYDYEGPELVYMFWSKHGPCRNAECGHRTPIMSTPVIAAKTLSVGVWRNRSCAKCTKTFDVEAQQVRIAPAALFVCPPDEPPFTIRNEDGNYDCPHCGHVNKSALGNSDKKDKKLELTLLVHPDWLKGAPGKDAKGTPFGGSVTSDSESTANWHAERAKTLKLIEVRGPLPEEIVCPDTKEAFPTGERGGTVPKRSTFTCKESTCGLNQDVLASLRIFEAPAPWSPYAIQGYCPACSKEGQSYGGKFFSTPHYESVVAACNDWQSRREEELIAYWPQSRILVGDEIGEHDVNGHHFTHWWMMFNHRQLLVHSLLLRAIWTNRSFSKQTREAVLGVFQQYLRNQNLFCFWNIQRALEPLFSDNHFHPKSSAVENSVFSGRARGDFKSCSEKLLESVNWCANPWEIASPEGVHSQKVQTQDPLPDGALIDCRSASSLGHIEENTIDVVVTDPPFGGLVQYAELSDFFYVWLRLALKDDYPDLFSADYTPKALEAVANRAREPRGPDIFYQKVLTQCWQEARRILKPSGLLAFTFHHSEDEPWVAVLESLFDAGFYLEATYPIRSDDTKGDGDFGSKKVEYDIIHVCRKRTEDTQEVSWARLRRQIMQDVKQLQEILTKHQTSGLQEADLQVIRRGKALEYYSKHYRKVFVEKGREFTVREALLAINQLLDDQADTTAEAPPVVAESYTRQFFRLFADKTSVPRDQMQKYLRGTGVSPQEFIDRGWCDEKAKVFRPVSPLELAQSKKGIRRDAMSRDFDQVMFIVGACFEGSGIKLSETLDNPNFKPHPATADLLDWLTRHAGTNTIKTAARTGLQLYRSWIAKNQKKVQVELTLFDLIDEGA